MCCYLMWSRISARLEIWLLLFSISIENINSALFYIIPFVIFLLLIIIVIIIIFYFWIIFIKISTGQARPTFKVQKVQFVINK